MHAHCLLCLLHVYLFFILLFTGHLTVQTWSETQLISVLY